MTKGRKVHIGDKVESRQSCCIGTIDEIEKAVTQLRNSLETSFKYMHHPSCATAVTLCI